MGSIDPQVHDVNVSTNGESATYTYDNHVLRKARPIHVVLIGAGVSGIGCYKLFKERFAGTPTTISIYEKNADAGGTWLENRYPGCSCDVPAHGYTYSWEGNPNWSTAYVGSVEICNYYQGRAKAFGVYEVAKFEHIVVGMTWDNTKGVWKVEVKDLKADRTFIDEAHVVINAGGFLNNWKWPDIPGLHDFKGQKMHSARWDPSYDFKDKTIAVIGSGSSAIQIVPSLQPIVKKMYSINRSATWITPEIGSESASEGRATKFTEEQKKRWAEDPVEFLRVRKLVEKSINHLYEIHFKGSAVQEKMATSFAAQMRERLKKKPEVAAKLIPTFGVGCRRITPGQGYLEALCEDNVEVEFSSVVRVTETGIVLENGHHLEVDCIVCATGFETSFRPRFPLIGNKGTDLRDVWRDDPVSYLSIMAPDFPNYFLVSGPNFTLANGVFIPCLETIFRYFFQAIEKIQTEGIKSFAPKNEAVEDFQIHKDALMKDMIWTSTCSSWYKNGKVDGKVWGPWPGSSLHFMDVMSQPRWEDFEIEYFRGNRFAFFGSGMTAREEAGGDLSYYLTERGVRLEDEPGTDALSFVG